MRWLSCYSIRHDSDAGAALLILMRTLSWVLLALVCGMIAPNVGLLEPGIIHDDLASEKPSPLKTT